MTADFSVVDAATSGARLLLRQPRVYAYWAGLNLLAVFAYFALLMLLFGEPVGQMMDAALEGRELHPDMLLLLIPRAAIALVILFPAGLFYGGVIRGAATRAMLSPEETRNAYLRFGRDEVRLAVVLLALAMISFVVQLICTVILMIPIGIMIAAGGEGGENSLGVQALQSLASGVTYLVNGLVWLKLALAAPQTLHERRIRILESWSLTKGRLLPMLVTYIIVWLMLSLVTIAVMLVGGALLFAMGADIWPLLVREEPDPVAVMTALRAIMLPAMLVFGLLAALVSPIYTALVYCPAADIYRQAVVRRPESVF